MPESSEIHSPSSNYLSLVKSIYAITIFTNFCDDAHAQQAFRDPSKMESLEKTRDAKIEKLLNNPKLYQQYQDALKMMNTEQHQHQHQQGNH
jgi:hypothetical protein